MKYINKYDDFLKLNESETDLIFVRASGSPLSSITVIFGGKGYATPTWMQSKLKSIKPNLEKVQNIVYAPHTMSLSEVERRIVAKWGSESAVDSIIGFSAGGYSVINAMTREFRFVGLIDPSIPNDYTNKKFGSYVNMIWGSPDMIQLFTEAQYNSLASKIKSAGGTAEKYNQQHDWFVTEFFKKFEKLIPISSWNKTNSSGSTSKRPIVTIGQKSGSSGVSTAGTEIEGAKKKAKATMGARLLAGIVQTATGSTIDPSDLMSSDDSESSDA
jgi:hypothetical protein